VEPSDESCNNNSRNHATSVILNLAEVLLAKIAGAMKASMAKAARTFDALRIKMEAGAPAAAGD
jgi:16S rRNA C1402 N4-methylase RsmH